MSARKIQDISWYTDASAESKAEPGIYHSYMASLASALNHIQGDLDPVWLMGTSAFAFRSFINETMCPSAMSIFNWSAILPEAVEQAGYHCAYVSRLWSEEDQEEERKTQAHEAIVTAIDRGVPAVVWDVGGGEWGLIIGYDLKNRAYHTLPGPCPGKLAFDKLGRNGIDILSVAIPGNPNGRSREERILNSLKAAVAHAQGKEWTERPQYQNGLPAFDLWATIYDRWALLVEAGKWERIKSSLADHPAYYAGHHYSARCYARDYLAAIANGDDRLQRASSAYAKVASLLKPVWDHAAKGDAPAVDVLRSLAQNIRNAKATEQEAINSMQTYLSHAAQ